MAPVGCEVGEEEDTETTMSRRSSPSTSPSGTSSCLVAAEADDVDVTCGSDQGPFYGMFDKHDTDADHDWSSIRLSSPRPGVPRSTGPLSTASIVGASETFHKVMQELDDSQGEMSKTSSKFAAGCCSKCGSVKASSSSNKDSTRSSSSRSKDSAVGSSSISTSSSLSSSSTKTSAGSKERKSSKPVKKSASFSTASSSTPASQDASTPPVCCPRCCRAESGKRRMSVPACMRSSKHVQWADEAGVSSLVSVRLIRPRLAKGEEGQQAAPAPSPRSILRRLNGSVH